MPKTSIEDASASLVDAVCLVLPPAKEAAVRLGRTVHLIVLTAAGRGPKIKAIVDDGEYVVGDRGMLPPKLWKPLVGHNFKEVVDYLGWTTFFTKARQEWRAPRIGEPGFVVLPPKKAPRIGGPR